MSDTEFLSQTFTDASEESMLDTLSTIKGPWCIIYHHLGRSRLYFGRDVLGRHSLLWSEYRLRKQAADLEVQPLNPDEINRESTISHDENTRISPLEGKKLVERICVEKRSGADATDSMIAKDLTASRLIVSSVGDATHNWEEVPAYGLYYIDLNNILEGSENEQKISIHLIPWNTVSPDSLATVDVHISNRRLLSSIKQPLNMELPDHHLQAAFQYRAETFGSLANLASSTLFDDDISELRRFLTVAVRRRVGACPPVCQRCSRQCDHCRIAVLFSGGLDSAVIARLLHECLPDGQTIDLINVAFEQNKVTIQNATVKKKVRKKGKNGERRIENLGNAKQGENDVHAENGVDSFSATSLSPAQVTKSSGSPSHLGEIDSSQSRELTPGQSAEVTTRHLNGGGGDHIDGERSNKPAKITHGQSQRLRTSSRHSDESLDCSASDVTNSSNSDHLSVGDKLSAACNTSVASLTSFPLPDLPAALSPAATPTDTSDESGSVVVPVTSPSAAECPDLFTVPDRLTGRTCVQQLRELCPGRRWNFVEVDVTRQELAEVRQRHIAGLLIPHRSVLDDSIGCALWCGARGQGTVEGAPYTSPARVLLCGQGADEQLCGYSRHRVRFERDGWPALLAEVAMEMARLHSRNLGRDDRTLADHARAPRYPYLDEDVVSFLNSLPLWRKADPSLPRGVGEKLLLRLLAHRLGLTAAASLPKRAIQFGSRIAKMENSKESGDQICDRLHNTVALLN